MDFTAKQRFAHISPTKLRPVADMIRGRPVNEALSMLKFTRKRGAHMLDKALRSAVANAGLEVDVEDLTVSRVEVDEGPRLKRGMERARGMMTPILRRLSHIRVVVSTREAGEEG